MKKARHEAEQLPLKNVVPDVRMGVTLRLQGDVAQLWRRFVSVHAAVNPSNGQLVEALIARGLKDWADSL